VDIYIARGEEQFGPYPLEQVRELLDQGALLPEDLAFHEGLENWTPLAEVIAKQSTPPVPPSPPALPSATVDSPSPAPDPQTATDPTVEPQLASVAATQPKPKKQVPVWLTIVILVLIVGGGVGYGAWYVFFKPNPEYSPTKWDKEDPSEEPGMGQSSTSENQNTGQPGGLTGPVIPSKPEPTPKPTPTPPSPSDPLARNILGKRLVCKTNEEVELIMQFAKDGTFGIGTDWQGQFSQHRETVHYSIDGLKVKLSDNGRENGGVTFPTDNPKAGDQISFGPEQKQITATILRIEPAKAFEISSNTSTGEDTTTTEPTVPEPVIEPKKLTPAQVEEILVQEIGSWRVKGNITTLDPKTGTGEAKEFEDKLETRWKEKGKSTISSFGAGMGQNLTGTTEYDSEMEWFVWRVQAEGRPETVSKNIYDPTTKTYHQLLMLPNDHVERGTFKRINKDEAILKSEVFNADNEVVATQEINFTRIDSDVTEPNEPEPNTPSKKPGTVLWEFKTGDEVPSSPAIGPDGTLYVGSTDKKLYAINGKSGVKLWEFETGGWVSSPAIAADGTIYVSSDKLYALDGKTGTKKWEYKTEDWKDADGNTYSEVTTEAAIGDDGTVYFGAYDKKIYALDSKTGTKKWDFSFEKEREKRDTDALTPTIGTDGTVYLGTSNGEYFLTKGWIYALDGKTGVKKWGRQVGGVATSPSIGPDGTVYVGTDSGDLLALDEKTGDTVWIFDPPSARDVDSSPVIGMDGTIYIAPLHTTVYAFDGKTGKTKWTAKKGPYLGNSPAIGADGTVFVATSFRREGPAFLALDGKTGTKIWDIKFTSEALTELFSSPVIGADGTVYTTLGKRLFAIKTECGGPAKSPWPMRGQNAQHTGRAVNTATEPTEPIEKKLSSAEVEKILAAQIGQWQVKGQVKQAEGDPIPYEFRMDIQWKDKGESISGKGSLEKNGQTVSLFSHKEYDPSKGVFAFRFRQGLRPEILSHEKYDPATQTFQGRQISPEEPEVTYSFQADGPDKFIFKMKTTRNGQLLSTDESIQTRIATNNSSTDPKPNTPAKKLTVEQASEIMAWEIGKWETKGQAKQLEGGLVETKASMECQWKEEGKSLEFQFTMTHGEQTMKFSGHKHYDAAKGVFVYRQWGEKMPESTSHEVYDLATKTYHGQSISPSNGPKTTTVTKRIGNDKTQQRLEVRTGDQLVYSHDIVSTRLEAETPNPEPTSGGDDKSAKIIEAAIRKAAKKPEGELTKADYEKVTYLIVNDRQLTSVKGLENLTQLKTLYLSRNKLTDVKGLEKLTQLKELYLNNNQLTSAKGLEKLTQLEGLVLGDNPDLTKAQIDQLQKALPKCIILSNPTK